MDYDKLNPYQVPEASSAVKGHARLRLRRWFAAALYLTLLVLYLALISDLFWGSKFGILPFLVSIVSMMLVLTAALLTRHRAVIELDDTRIAYRDLVQIVDVSWDRVAEVSRSASKILITTESRFIQITVSQRHADYELIAGKIDELRSKYGF
jgi:hypothetical protein